jgi:hypothetical protein
MKKALLLSLIIGSAGAGAFAQVDAKLVSVEIPFYVSPEGSAKITGVVKNNGSSALSNFDINWTDGFNTFSYEVTSSIASGANYNFTLPDEITTVPAGFSANIEVTVVADGDADATNNSLSETVEGIPFVPEKVVVGEEATGTWCGWCPRGAVWMEYMEENYPEQWIGIAVHNNDPMENADYDSWIGGEISGYPSGLVDRKSDIDPSNFEANFLTSVDDFGVARIKVEPFINDQDEVWIRVRTQFAKASDKSMRIAVALVEDNVTGTTSGYNQANYYSYQSQNLPLVGAGHNWQQEPVYVPAADMVYNDVARELYTNASGESGSIPSSVAAEEVVIFEIDPFTWNSDYKKEDSRIVAMLLNNSNGNVINATESHLIAYEEVEVGGTTYYVIDGDTYLMSPEGQIVPVGIASAPAKDLNVQLYPNPATDMLNIKGLNGICNVVVYDMKGSVVLKSSVVDNRLNIESLQAGVYAIEIENKGLISVEKFTILK